VSRIDAATVYKSYSAYLLSQERPAREMYRLLRWYYENNGLYERLRHAWPGVVGTEAMAPLRNPANRVVEFYAAKLWPGELPDAYEIQTENEAIIAPIQRIWSWSHWGVRKQVFARWLAMYGDAFAKIVRSNDGDRVYIQLIEPEYVTDFDGDERDYLNYIRLDIPRVRREGDEVTAYTHTEVWSKEDLSYRVWEHDKPVDTPIERLGRPTVNESNYLTAFGIDFLPFVHCKFRDVGEDRGVSAYGHALDKLDEANRMMTRLHQMLYRHNGVTWALQANATDPSGRPLPAPQLDKNSEDQIELGGERFLRLPGNAALAPLVPQLQYEAALAIAQDHMLEMERDLPELAYYRMRENSQTSGRAVRLLLSDAIDRAMEARGNAVSALVRMHQMALTLGQVAKLEGFGPAQIGTYETGAFEHSIKLREIVPLNEMERLEALAMKQALNVPTEQLWKEAGYSEDKIAEMRAMAEAQSSVGERLLRNFETQFGMGA